MRRLIQLALAALLSTVMLFGSAFAPAPAPVHAQAGCTFQLGFLTLRNLITANAGRDVVGACLENERFNPSNGNAEQRTAGGLMVWRKSDNWTAFTDGHRTYLNGPTGLQVRLNTESFSWERNTVSPAMPAPVRSVPTPTVLPQSSGAGAARTPTYKVSVSRTAPNIYRDTLAQTFILTSACIELALGDDAILEYAPGSPANSLIFSNRNRCSVVLVGDPNVTLTRRDQNLYQDSRTGEYLRTSACYEYVYGEDALVARGRVYFQGGACDLALGS